MQKLWIFDTAYQTRAARLRSEGFDAYCLFSLSENEVSLAYKLMRLNTLCVAMPFLRMMHKSVNGKKSLVQDVLLKGYVFVYVPSNFEIEMIKSGEIPFKVLVRVESGGRLNGDDRRYAEWVLEQGGMLDVSKAIRLNDKVKIVSGPLLGLQGSITETSKKNRNCKVQFSMMGRDLKLWLPFEWMDLQK